MDDSLNKIAKTVSKSKNKELITLCQKAIGKSLNYIQMLGLT